MKGKNKKREGFTLIIVLMMMTVISLLGLTIISTTASGYKMSKIDSRSQSTYYIAEAGVNQTINTIKKEVDKLSEEALSHDEFFNLLDKYINKDLKLRLDNFEDNKGDKSLAEINVVKDKTENDEETDSISKRAVSYKIESLGRIGNSNRKAAAFIEIVHGIGIGKAEEAQGNFKYAIYSDSNNAIPSGSNIDGSIYGGNIDFKASGSQVSGSIISKSSVKLSDSMTVKGSVYALNGSVEIKSSGTNVEGDIHASGNVDLLSGANTKSIYTNGNLKARGQNKIDGSVHAKGNVDLGSDSQLKDIYTNGDVEFSSNNTINGDIHAKDYIGSNSRGSNVIINGNLFSGGNITTRDWQGYKITGIVNAAGDVINGSGNTIAGDVISGSKVVNLGTITGGRIVENGNPIKPQAPKDPVSPNFGEYALIEKPKLTKELLNYSPIDTETIISTDTLKLNPGHYGKIKFNTHGGGTLLLKSGGEYFFNSITGENQNKTLRFDFSQGGDIKIYIKNKFKWNGNIEISTDSKTWKRLKSLSLEEQKSFAKRIYWEVHDDFEIHEGGDKVFIGNLLCKEDIKVVGGTYAVGALSSNSSFKNESNYGIHIIHAYEGKSNVGNESPGSSSNVDGKGENVIAKQARIKIIKPIREN